VPETAPAAKTCHTRCAARPRPALFYAARARCRRLARRNARRRCRREVPLSTAIAAARRWHDAVNALRYSQQRDRQPRHASIRAFEASEGDIAVPERECRLRHRRGGPPASVAALAGRYSSPPETRRPEARPPPPTCHDVSAAPGRRRHGVRRRYARVPVWQNAECDCRAVEEEAMPMPRC